jgi:hypothetical protein
MRSSRVEKGGTSELQKQVVELACKEMLETVIAEMEIEFDPVASLRAQLTLIFAARVPTRTRERGRTVELHICHVAEGLPGVMRNSNARQ